MPGDWEIVMPRLSDTMTEGVVTRWLAAVGDPVSKGEPVVEIETEKATLEVVSEADGFLVEISAGDGTEVPTGGRIGYVAPERDAPVLPAAPDPPLEAHAAQARATSQNPSPPAGALVSQPVNGERIAVSPVARKLAQELGVDLREVAGRGPQGRILRTDVERAAHDRRPPVAGRTVSRRHAAMARRMTVAKTTVPHFYLSVEVDATRLEALRADLKRSPDPSSVSVTALVVKACGLALRAVPAVNASWQHDGIVANERVNVGIAVALESGELLVPVIADADLRTPAEIHAELDGLARGARNLDLTEEDLRGATFTVSNMGMLGVDAAYAIVNPPESGILAVGAVRDALALEGGQVVPRSVMTLGLSGDHRVYSGATGAAFLRSVRDSLGNPISLFADSVSR